MALMRAVHENQVDPSAQLLAEDLELLTTAQRTRLEGGNLLRTLLRSGLWFALVVVAPLVGFVLGAVVAIVFFGASDGVAMVAGVMTLGPLVLAGFVAAERLKRAGVAAELERKRRAVSTLRQLEVSSVASTSSVAVPVMSSMPHQPK
jgi:hypothetical protein